MTPREVFEAMRPFYPEWPTTFEKASVITQAACRAIAKEPSRLRAWLEMKDPAPRSRDARFVVSRKPFTGIDGKLRAAGERPDDDKSDE